MQSPTDIHWSACKRILRYLKGSINHGLHMALSTHSTLSNLLMRIGHPMWMIDAQQVGTVFSWVKI